MEIKGDYIMLLSIIVPCYNCNKTIERLLQSILDNSLNKEDYQVIICDDKSTDNFLEKVKPFEKNMNIIYCETYRPIHCPGNTREAALPYIEGEWFTFIDNDDMFEPYAFKEVFKYIKEHEVKYTLCTEIREYFVDKQIYGREIKGSETDTWLHGKFFNTENTLKKFKCHFKADLMSHEDVYFNSCNLAHLITIDEDYIYYPIFTYKWVYNPNSLSRSYFSKKDFYIDTYLDDFMKGACYPFFDMFLNNEDKNKKDFAFNQIMMTLLHGYFYYQSSLWRLGANDTLIESYNALKNLKRKIIKELKVTELDIIKYIYSNPQRYDKIKMRSIAGCCAFVEVQSFRDFIMNL
jgi:glycosyltransferase involved in cell wall biosynthesis